MTKIALLLAALCLATILTPVAQAQACGQFDPNGRAGIYEGDPYAHYTVLDCKMTPIRLRFGDVPAN